MKNIKTVALVGLGAIGCYIAEGIIKAVGYENFRVIADGDRKNRIENEGAVINGVLHKFKVVSASESMPAADLIIIATKMNQFNEALHSIKNQVGCNTIIMSLLNGIESEEIISKIYGEEKVIYSVTRAAVTRIENNVIYRPESCNIEFGEKKNDKLSERVVALSKLFDAANIKYVIEKDMIRAIWKKFMCNVSENQSSAILGIPFGAWRENIHANYVREAAMHEVIEVAQKLGVDISTEDLIKQREVLKQINASGRTSMLQDIEAGRKTEVEMFSGTMVRLGEKLKVPTPINALFYHMIRTLEDKNSGEFNFK
ncbi:2-dehydropantoate 2-reductase [Clostridium felsineum]|uniref:ketopantoate reductase family protein n=1 Tax=Clostridium felsineum TaxID=36839 RepID=UPI00098CDC0D|nr:2-dehydropantoate 2-reductase [Clostridium felsineum]MCR3759454.1 2-dehydropantoate 2-reductase [Clostridium felsineum]URZ01632.1 2-dehydropantoate 2-reductase [Clostridium felsineum]